MYSSMTPLFTIISLAALGGGFFCIYKYLNPSQKKFKGYYPVNARVISAENLAMPPQASLQTAVPMTKNIDILDVEFEFNDVTCNKNIKIKNSVGFKEGMAITLLYNPDTFDLVYEQEEENSTSFTDALSSFGLDQILSGNTFVIGIILIIVGLFSLSAALGRMDFVYLITAVLLICNFIFQLKRYKQYQNDRMSGMFDTVKATCVEHKMRTVSGRRRETRYQAVYLYVYNGISQKYTSRKLYTRFRMPQIGTETYFPLNIRTGKIEEAPNIYLHGMLALLGIGEMIMYFVMFVFR